MKAEYSENRLSELYPLPIKISDNFFCKSVPMYIDGSIEEIFKIVSNTSLINKFLGVPKRFEKEVDGQINVDTTFLGKPAKWIELPWRWSYGKYIIAERKHEKGFYNHEYSIFHFEKSKVRPGYDVVFFYRADVKSIFLKILLNLTFKSFVSKIEEAIRFLVANPDFEQTEKIKTKSSPNQIRDRIKDLDIKKEHKSIMEKLIFERGDDSVYRIQIPKLAQEFNENEQELLSSFLKACKVNLFEVSWDTLCPHCHGTRNRNSKLIDLLIQSECPACEISFQLDKVELIDVTFRIPASIREVQNVSYCAAEPFKKHHILFQDDLSPEDEKYISVKMKKGSYRVRVLGKEESLSLNVDHDGVSEINWNLDDSSLLQNIGNKINLKLKNQLDNKVTIAFEHLTTPPFYFSPLNLFNHPDFREFFLNDGIGKGVQLKMPIQNILFSDVVGSTVFYQEVGDEEAYNQIKLHFDIVNDVLKRFDGVLIKTIGDAVMATFKNFQDIIPACREISTIIDQDSRINFKLRYSVHCGPVVAVNFNTGVDYFGDNVNIAAKLQAISEADEISMSKEFQNLLESKEQNNPILEKLIKKTYLKDKEGYVLHFKDIDESFS